MTAITQLLCDKPDELGCDKFTECPDHAQHVHIDPYYFAAEKDRNCASHCHAAFHHELEFCKCTMICVQQRTKAASAYTAHA
jgi:hypothetical protein